MAGAGGQVKIVKIGQYMNNFSDKTSAVQTINLDFSSEKKNIF